MLHHSLAHRLFAFCLVVFLDLLPLSQYILYTQLSCDLFLYLLRFRHRQAALPIRLHSRHIHHFPGLFRLPGVLRSGILRSGFLLPHLIHHQLGCIIPDHTAFVEIIPIDHLLYRNSFFCLFRRHIYLACFTEEHFRIVSRHFPRFFRLQRILIHLFDLGKIQSLRIAVHHGLGCSFLRKPVWPRPALSHNFLKPFCQLLLQIDRIELTHIHGLHMNIQVVRCGLRFSIYRRPPRINRHILTGFLSLLFFISFIRLILCVLFIHVLRRKTIVVFLLLPGGERLMQHLKLHRLDNILSLPEPENQFVTFLHTAG